MYYICIVKWEIISPFLQKNKQQLQMNALQNLIKIILLLTTNFLKVSLHSNHLHNCSLPISSLCPASLPKPFSTSWPIFYPPIPALRYFRQTIFTSKQELQKNQTPTLRQLSPYVTYNIHILIVHRAILIPGIPPAFIRYVWSALFYLAMYQLKRNTL